MNPLFVFPFGLGFAAGLRALTPPAVVAWAAHFGWLDLKGTPLSFMGSTSALVIFTLLALFELANDPRPKTPKRTSAVPLAVRIVTGGFCGACLQYAGHQGWIAGAILGGIGAIIGAFAGYETRRRLVAALNTKDILIALLEDLIAIGLACFVVSR